MIFNGFQAFSSPFKPHQAFVGTFFCRVGVTNAVYPCTEPPPYYSLFFDNDIYGVVLAIGAAPPGTPRPAMLNIGNEYYSEYETLTETAAGSGVFTNASHSARLLQIAGQPRLAVSDGVFLTNTIFTVWEAAPQSGEYRNYNAPIPTDLPPEDIAVPDFVPWRLRITGASNTSLVEEVSIVTSVDSTNQITFTYVNGNLLSDQKFILIPDGNLVALPSQDYIPIRINTLESKWWDEEQKDVTASMTLASGTRSPNVTLENSVKSQNGAVVLESLPSYENWGTSTYRRFVKPWLGKGPFQQMGYTVTPDLRASVANTLNHHIKDKQIWYSLSHGAVEHHTLLTEGEDKGKFVGPFQGLEFLNNTYITADDLKPLNLDYRLVLADACFSAQTVWTSMEEAAASNELSKSAAAFADSFGPNAAYVGWAWIMTPSVSQKYMAELAQNLLYDKSLGRGRTVAEAHQKLLADYANDSKALDTLSLMKLHGATNNVIDLRRRMK